MTLEKKLEEAIKKEIDCLEHVPPGTEEHAVAAESITKMVDSYLKSRTINLDEDRFELEREKLLVEAAKNKAEKWDAVAKNAITVITFAGGMGIAVWGTVVSMKFEKEDTFTSLLGRKWVDKTLSFMKK